MGSFITPNMNMFAPPTYNGVNQGAIQGGGGFTDIDFTYPFDITLTANQNLPNQAVGISNDADFALRAIILSANTGAFQFRLSDSQGYFLSNGYLLSTMLLIGGAPYPFTVFPEVIFPAGGKIGIDLIDVSGGNNTIEILFRGVKRYQIVG